MQKGSLNRFREIVKVLAFYGFGYIVDSKIKNEKNSPRNLRRAFEELGPTFIKIGQILSTRPDILSEPYVNELSKLQDSAPPESFQDVNQVFYDEFHENISKCFKQFNKFPMACASIAQVHEAVLFDGTEVIVKIQRPDIEDKMKMDIDILYRLAKLAKFKFSDAIIDPEEALGELLNSTKQELNFKIEAQNIKKFKKLNENVAFVYAPYLIEDMCSKRVLTMEKINGFKILDMESLEKGGYDLSDLGRKLALSYFKQVFTDGFFHGDPHPGNILINEGKICFIDFGIMGTLNKSLKHALNDIVTAIAYRDIDKVISVIMSIAVKRGYVNRNKLYEDIDYLFDSYLSTSLENIKMSELLQEFLETAKRNNLSVPKDLVILAKTLVIVEGVAAKIDPEIKILDIAVPFVKESTKASILNDLSYDDLLLTSFNFVRDISRLPSKMIKLSEGILNGRAKVQLQINNLNKSISALNKMTNRLVFGLIVSSMIIASSMILKTNTGPKIFDMSILGFAGYIIAAIMSLWLLISIIKSGKL